MFNPATVMPAYHRADGFHRVLARHRGDSIYTAQDVIDPRDTRRAVAWGLELAARKQVERPAKKRGILPV